MNDEIKVSIICNAFNHEPFIRDALEGFVTQKTNFSYEVLVHDDASTDGTAAIIQAYAQKYPTLIRPICQEENQFSKGVRITRTFQLPRAKGKYIALCEGDDYWTDPLKLQKQYDFMESNPDYSLCTCSTVFLDVSTGQMQTKYQITEDRDFTAEELILEEKGRAFQYATFFIKTDVFRQSPRWITTFPVGDYPLSINAALNGRVRMLADTMTVYRFGTAGSWTANLRRDTARAARISRRMIQGLQELDADTQGRYHTVIQQRIRLNQYESALRNRDWKALKSDELRPIYRSKSFSTRMKHQFSCRFPRVYDAVNRMLKGSK